MILSKASVTMHSSHSLSQAHTRQATGQIWMGKAPPVAGAHRSLAAEGGSGNDWVTISNAARAGLLPQQAESPGGRAASSPDELGNLGAKMQTMRRLLELLTGKKITLAEFQALSAGQPANMKTTSAAAPPAANQPQPAGWGVRCCWRQAARTTCRNRFNDSDPRNASVKSIGSRNRAREGDRRDPRDPSPPGRSPVFPYPSATSWAALLCLR